jgi:flagellar operon protein
VADPKIDPTRLPIEQIGRVAPRPVQPEAGTSVSPATDGVFDGVLREQLSGLKFSAHAVERMSKRNIRMTPNELERLRGAVERAEEKGARDTLVLVEDKAFVVSVKNKTVITALSGQAIKEGVFTKIDSAVVS